MAGSDPAELIRLGEGVLSIVVVDADDGLILPTEEIIGNAYSKRIDTVRVITRIALLLVFPCPIS